MIVNWVMSRRLITARACGVACVGFTVGLVLLVLMLVGQAQANGAKVKPATITLWAKFTPVLPGMWFMSSNRYVFISTGQGTGVVIDDQTGRRTALTLPSGCGAAQVGGPWLVLGCGPDSAERLYDMATGQTTPFVPSPALQQPPFCPITACGPVGGIVRIGNDWAELGLPDGDPEHVLDQFAFQNLQTGQAVVDPTGATTTVNLDSPALADKVCAPLTVPTWRRVYGQAPGTLTPIGGGFEIADGNNSYLERCGTHLHQLLESDLPYNCAPPTCGPTGNPHVVVFGTGSFLIDGMFLPSRQRFSIPIAQNVAGQIGLAARHLYLGGEGNRIWTTPIPRPPKPQPKKR